MGLRSALRAVLDEDRIAYEVIEGRTMVRLTSLAPADEWSIVAQWGEEDDVLVVFAVCALAVPTARRPAVMELLNRANLLLRAGCFVIDLEDGELRFRDSVDFEGIDGSPAAEAIRHLIYNAAGLMRRYLPAVAAVVNGADPAETVASVSRRPVTSGSFKR